MGGPIPDKPGGTLVPSPKPGEGVPPGPWERYFWHLAALILLAAFLLRGAGLAGGLPLIYHPDTMKQVNYLDQQVVRGNFPFLADGYPVGHMQVACALLAGAQGLARWLGLEPVWKGHRLYVWARLVVVGFGLLGLVWLMLAGRLLFGAGVGLLAGLLWAGDELTLIHSHYAMGDIPQAAMIMGALYFSARILRHPRWWDWLLAGLFVGLAAGIKYFGGFMLLGLAAAHLLNPRRRWSLVPWGLLGAAAGFVLVTPYLLYDFATWSRELWLEFCRQSARSLLKQEHIAGWIWYGITHSFAIWTQRSLLVPYLAPLALAALAWRRRRADWLLLVPSLAVLFIVVVLRSNYLRDWDHLAVAPFLFLALARGFQIAWRSLPPARTLPGGLRPRPLLAGLLILGLAGQGWCSLETSYLLTLPDTRDQARYWLKKRLPPARPGQVILSDITFNTARAINTSVTYIPSDRGYRLRLLRGEETGRWKADLRGAHKKDVGFIILHGLHGRPTMTWLQTWTPPLEIFRIGRRLGWHLPEIRFYEPEPRMLRIPWRPLAVYAQGWGPLSPVNTPYAARLVRELVMRKGTVARTLVSDQPLAIMGIMVQGSGRLQVEQGGKQLVISARPSRPRVEDWRPRRGWPFNHYFYPIRLRAREGHFLVRLLLSRAELAAAYARAGQEQRARDLWAQAQAQGETILPQDRLVWACSLWRAGRKEAAQKVYAPLAGSGLVAAIKAAPHTPDQELLTDLARGLGADPRALDWRALDIPMTRAGRTVGWSRYDPAIQARALFLPAGRPGWSKLWMGQSLTCPDILVRFWIKAAPGPEEELATVDVYGHHRWKGRGVLARAPVKTRGGGGYFPVELRLRLPMLPMRLEARVNSRGRRDVWVSRLEVVPDVAAWTRRRLSGLPGLARDFR